MRERPGSLAVPPFEAAERLTVPDPKRDFTNGRYRVSQSLLDLIATRESPHWDLVAERGH
jgi:hypothetical protein